MAKIITYKNEPNQVFSQIKLDSGEKILISCTQDNIKIFKLFFNIPFKSVCTFQIQEAVNVFMEEKDWGSSILDKIVDWAMKCNSIKDLISEVEKLKNKN